MHEDLGDTLIFIFSSIPKFSVIIDENQSGDKCSYLSLNNMEQSLGNVFIWSFSWQLLKIHM